LGSSLGQTAGSAGCMPGSSWGEVRSRSTERPDAVEAGQVEVLADERSRFVKASLSRDHELIYPETQSFWDALLNGTPL
jgi:hypothetical protein